MHSDLIIIGAGPGGYETALAAARRGLSVTLFEGRGDLGGTCLNEGCIPTKCLCRNAEVVENLSEASRFGIEHLSWTLDFEKVQSRKEEVVAQLRAGIEQLMKMAKVNVIREFARFKDAHTVIAGEDEFTADNIIIASGSTPRSLPIPGHDLECVMDSTVLLAIDHVPESLTIIGGGVIGMEFASVFASFGSKVTVIEFMKQILPPFDSDIAKRLKQALTKKGIKILTSAAAREISQKEDGKIVVSYESKGKTETVESTHLLMAVGRAPRVDGLDLDAAGVSYSPKGIPVDDMMRTNIPGIYAIGDVNARMMLAHVATFQGLRALDNIQGREDEIDFSLVPSAVFTRPECGMVGLTEDQCKESGMKIRIGQSFFRANGKSLAMGESEGLVKLIFEAESGKLVGAHIMGVEAADLAQQCCDMMNAGMTLEKMEQVIFSHPSVSEVLLSAVHAVK